MKYLEHVWYCSALSSDIGAKPVARVICEKPVVLFRTESGRVAALEDRCVHRQAPLSMGRVQGEELECAYHGFTYDRSGVCVHIPHQDSIPAAARIEAYPAVERWGYVWLWLGQPDLADPAKIPDLPWNEEQTRRAVYFHWTVAANFQLMADNLLDVSHTDFLHRHSIGSQTGRRGQTDTPKVELDSRVEGERVFSMRRVHNTMLGPVAARWVKSEKPVVRTNHMMWELPNTVHSKLVFENEECRATIHMEHIMTPATPTTMHYFLNWTRDFGLDNANYPTDKDVWNEQTAVVTVDDIPMVEAQQRNLDRFGMIRDIGARQDRFVTTVHRLLRDIYGKYGKPVPIELGRTGIALQAS